MISPHRLLRSRHGYSLIELMVVVVLIGLVVSIAGPSLQGSVTRQRARRALDQTLADVAFTRVIAVREGMPTEIEFTASGRYTMRRLPPGGSPVTLRTVELWREYPGVGLDVVTGVAKLQFSSRGLLRNLSSDGFIKIASSSARDSAFVSPAGRVYRAR